MNTLDFTGLTLEQKFEAAGKFAGVPAQLFDGIWATESTRGQNMTSPKGARGHFQTMPDTQATWEKRTGRKYDPDNFDDSLTMAALTMRENIQRFKTIPDALKAYNSGWDRSKWGNEETQAYVGKVYEGGGVASAGALTVQENAMGSVRDRMVQGEPFDRKLFDAAWRGDDLGDLGSVAAMKRRLGKQYLSDVEKGVADDAGNQAAAAATIAGRDDGAQMAQAATAAVTADAEKNVEAAIAASGQAQIRTNTSNVAADVVNKSEAAALEREEYVNSLTWQDKWGANFGTSILAGMIRYMDNEVKDYYPEGWSYAENARVIEDGYSMREREQLREAVSPDDVERIKGDIRQQRMDAQIQGTLSGSSQLGWALGAGFTDPGGWAAGFGMGKAAQVLKVGATTYARAGRPVAAVIAGAGEGGLGNLVAGAALDALGDYRTTGDYASDLGFGLAFGGILTLPGMSRDVELGNLQREAHANAATQNAELVLRAQELAGPNATPDQLKRAFTAVEEADDQSWRLATLGNVDNKDRLFARADVGTEPTAEQNFSVFASDADRQKFIDDRDLEMKVVDPDMRAMVAEVIARAEQINGRVDLDPAKLKTFLSKVNLEATSTTMLSSESSVARAVAAMLMENPEGAAGRRSTASISRSAHFEEYMGNISRNTDSLYEMWAKQQGAGTVRANFDDQLRIRFNKEVQLEMDRRWNKRPEGAIHPMVARAADLYDIGYNKMARDQKFVGVLGSDALDLSTQGYFQRSWNLARLRGMQGSQRAAFLSALDDQFRTVAGFTDSPDFKVKTLAIEYLTRLEHRATGMVDVPANIYSGDAGLIIKDALHAMGLTADQVETQMKRFTRGASGHTKNRIDMDYSKQYDDGAGNKFTLVDFLDNDMNGLYRRYAQRTAGDVALAKYGIMGDNGLKVLREAMLRTDAEQKTLDAFDQWAAEMTGKRFGNGDPLLLQNARMLTNLTRMGGAVFPQMGAYIDAAIGLGATRALRSAGSLNTMRREVQALARGEKVNNPILGGFEGIGPDFGVAEYRIFGIFDTTDMVDIAGRETVGRTTKAIRAGSNLQRVLSGHRWVTAAQTRGFADQLVRKALRFVKEGGESAALRDMGINDDMIAKLKPRLKDIATFDKTGELMGFDPRKLSPEDVDGRKAVIEFRDAIMRGTNQIMNKEFPGEVGKWAHNGWLKTLFQFRTFSMIAQQKSFNRVVHTHGVGKFVGLVLGGMAVAAPIHAARVALRASLMQEGDRDDFIEKQLHPLALGRATMNYLAAIGLWADVVESASGLGAGWADAMNMELPDGLRPTGGRMMKDTNLIGGQFAPSLGVINDIGQGVMGKPDKLWKTAPFASLPYIQPLLLGIESAVDDE